MHAIGTPGSDSEHCNPAHDNPARGNQARGNQAPSTEAPSQVYRLWIARYRHWQPTEWSELPPLATAVEPASESPYSAADARLFIEGFNSQMLRDERELWAVAVPVVLRFEGDLRAGEQFQASACTPVTTLPAPADRHMAAQ